MESAVFIPCYFGPIDFFSALAKTEKVLWEKHDNYQKQTYRTRQYIYGPNGKLLLNIPIVHPQTETGKQPYTEVEIDNSTSWQIIHWRGMEAAYRSSPFFEFYEDDLFDLYNTPFDSLFEFNLKCLEVLAECLGMDLDGHFTEEFLNDYSEGKIRDCRSYSVAKRKPLISLEEYDQVFQEKHGFLPNLSILDLLFNKGPESYPYLLDQA